MSATGKQLAVLCGSFDPIHYGHLEIGELLYREYQIDRIVVIPCACSPFKARTWAAGADRLRMIELAIANRPYMTVDDCELHRAAPSYTIDTLRYLTARTAEHLILVIGSDHLPMFDRWYQWEQILSLASLIVVNRGLDQGKIPASMKAVLADRCVDDPRLLVAGKIFMTSRPPIPISSTEIRERIKAGLSVEHLLPPEVLRYINERKLYNN